MATQIKKLSGSPVTSARERQRSGSESPFIREPRIAVSFGRETCWLIGPFVLAHLRVYKHSEMARRFLEPMGKQITTAGLGTLSEIFDGDAPFHPRGCIAQAWTVAEVLRAWRATIT